MEAAGASDLHGLCACPRCVAVLGDMHTVPWAMGETFHVKEQVWFDMDFDKNNNINVYSLHHSVKHTVAYSHRSILSRPDQA